MKRVLLSLLLCISSAARAYDEAPVTNGGTISGRVSFLGRPPSKRFLTVTLDVPVCGAKREEESFQVAKDGGVKDVVVHLLAVPAGKPWATEAQPVLDQKGCHYLPHVQVVRQHAKLLVKSSDPVLHNVHSFFNGTTVINLAVPPRKGLVLQQTLDKAGGMQLKCDVHSFMRGGLFVADNPYYALTRSDGTYEIEGVPPGKYTIATWHEVAGSVSEPIEVSPNGKVTWNARVR